MPRGAPATWSVEDVVTFLKILKLDSYEALIRDNEVDGAVLVDCDKEDIKALGISDDFHARKLMTKLKAAGVPPASPVSPAPPASYRAAPAEYEPIRLIGRGSFGKTVLAKEQSGCEVAIKQVRLCAS